MDQESSQDPYEPASSISGIEVVERNSKFRTFFYWLLVTLGYLILILCWNLTISMSKLSSGMIDEHAKSDSEGGSFFWFMLGKAAMIGLLGWHSMPMALCSSACLIRRREDILSKKLHRFILFATVLSFVLSILHLIVI